MKELNGGKQMKSVWEIGLCTGKERLRDENGNKLYHFNFKINQSNKIFLR
jgi:hypothetical protein